MNAGNPVFSACDGYVLISVDSIVSMVSDGGDRFHVETIGGNRVSIFYREAKLLQKVWCARLEARAKEDSYKLEASAMSAQVNQNLMHVMSDMRSYVELIARLDARLKDQEQIVSELTSTVLRLSEIVKGLSDAG